MSWLAPLYLTGLLAVAIPVILHLIRRQPKERTQFSSLLFLEATPPLRTERRQFDQLLLLCLRAAALIVLALAFARPFLRTADAELEARGERVAILFDRSASMRRAGVFEAARRKALELVDAVPARATLSLHDFDQALEDRFVPSATGLSANDGDARDAVRDSIRRLEPGQGGTDLGEALVQLADRLASAAGEAPVPARILLVSDLAEGADLSALDAYEWPASVTLELCAVPGPVGNASLELAPEDFRRADDPDALFVRVDNGADALRDRFELVWSTSDDRQDPAAPALSFTVDAGDSRIVRAPDRPSADCDRLLLRGDEGSDFDDVLYFAPPSAARTEVRAIGPDDELGTELQFFLASVFHDRPGSPLDCTSATSALAPLEASQTPLVVLRPGGDPSASPDLLPRYVEQGGVLLLPLPPLDDPAAAARARELLRSLLEDETVDCEEAAVDRQYALVQDVDFAHPVFQPFDDPRYRDFSRIRIWHHRAVHLHASSEARVVAKLDTGDPLLLDRPRGLGHVFVLTSSWARSDSDLARSSKFPALLLGVRDLAVGHDPEPARLVVGDLLPVARLRPDSEIVVEGPGGRASASGEEVLRTVAPGIHRVEVEGRRSVFAVQLDPRESRTEPLDPEILRQRSGIQFGARSEPTSAEHERQKKDVELESSQKWWRWLVVAAVGTLILETLYAAYRPRRGVVEAVPGSVA